MRTIAEIRNDINAKVAEAKGIDRNNVEAMDQAMEALKGLTAEPNLANEVEADEQRAADKKLADMQKGEGRAFSMVKFVRELSEGRLTGLEAEVAEMGAEEYRRLGLTRVGHVIPSACLRAAVGQNYTTAADGGNLIETMASRYVEVLKERLVVAQLGATVLTDLVGNVPVITSSQISASWAAEAGAATATKAAFAKAVMTPHRNVVQTAVTKDLLRQTSYDVERFLIDRMTEAHANLIEAAAIAGTGSSNQPTGILNNSNVPVVAMGTNNGLAITWAKVVELETTVNNNNANKGRMAYLTNAKVMGSMKSVEKASNTGRFIYEGGELNGYKVDWTGLVPSDLTKGTSTSKCSAMIFGNFQDLYIGEWGGIDLVVDPYTQAGTGEVVLTINAYNDVLVAEPKSFAVIKDILA